MNHSQDANCNSFNSRRMFDEFNGFVGNVPSAFNGASDRNINWLEAKGGRSKSPIRRNFTGNNPHFPMGSGSYASGRGAVRPTSGGRKQVIPQGGVCEKPRTTVCECSCGTISCNFLTIAVRSIDIA